jgi:hypothetical protein
MATPLYDGLPIFGPAPVVIGRRNPPERWWHGYPGIHGLQTVVGGSRGDTIEAHGVLSGATLAALVAAQTAFELYKSDGGAYTLIDTKGTTWPNAILIDFTPVGRVLQDGYGYAQDYRALFRTTT